VPELPASGSTRRSHRLDLATETLIAKSDARTAGATAPSEPDLSSKLSALIASPRGVMILVPLLVLALGATLTIVGQTALGSTSKQMARERFVEKTETVSLRLEQALLQAEPLLEELARVARSEDTRRGKSEKLSPRTETALEMRDLLIGRRAITQAYIAFPDGTFLSADPIAPSAVEFQITSGGNSKSYRVQRQTLHQVNEQESDYDPRIREWYVLAKNKRTRIWSKPYAFYFNQHPGITRALPVYVDKERTKLLAVVGVDFDVDALTQFMADGETEAESAKSVVFTIPGAVLAYPSGAERLAAHPKGEDVPTHGSLGDPELSALVRRIQGLASDDRSREELKFKSRSLRMLASVRKVGAGGPDWYVATFAPEGAVLSELYEHRSRSLWIGSISLLVAMAMAWFLARHLLHVRKVASAAQAAARQAVDQMRIFGSYRLLSRIGEGGMGEVWRARHQLLARQAAIKLIKRDPDNDHRHQEHQERFRREAQAIASLRSRNTVALFDYGLTAEGTLFYVMELLDGIDLSTLVSRHGAQPQERVRQILMQACNSLGEAHDAGLVHRDVKPANLFLCREANEVDVVKVLDFGLVFQAGLNDADTGHGRPHVEPRRAAADGWRTRRSQRKNYASRSSTRYPRLHVARTGPRKRNRWPL